LKIHGWRNGRVKNSTIMDALVVLEERRDVNPISQPGTDNFKLWKPVHDLAPSSIKGGQGATDKGIRITETQPIKIRMGNLSKNVRRGWEGAKVRWWSWRATEVDP
jgi:hypothetical protein